MARIWSSDKPIRGTVGIDKDWPYGSRPVIRKGMTDMYFNLFSHYNLSRRTRRAMARAKMHNVYRATKQDQIERGIVGKLTKKETWLVALAKKAADIFTLS